MRKQIDTAKLSKQFNEAHEIGAKKFGWNWMIANKQAIRACQEVGLKYDDPQMRVLLSLAALHVLSNTQPDQPLGGLAEPASRGGRVKRIPKRPKLSDCGDRDILMERAAGQAAAPITSCETCRRNVPTVAIPCPPDTYEQICGDCANKRFEELAAPAAGQAASGAQPNKTESELAFDILRPFKVIDDDHDLIYTRGSETLIALAIAKALAAYRAAPATAQLSEREAAARLLQEVEEHKAHSLDVADRFTEDIKTVATALLRSGTRICLQRS